MQAGDGCGRGPPPLSSTPQALLPLTCSVKEARVSARRLRQAWSTGERMSGTPRALGKGALMSTSCGCLPSMAAISACSLPTSFSVARSSWPCLKPSLRGE
jgi:hypothetical protein